jgi:hypothetical protein
MEGVPEGVLAVVDGHHRIEACRRCNLSEIDARITIGDERDAAMRAAVANIKHAQPLGAGGRLKAFRTFMEWKGNVKADGSTMSYAEIVAALHGTYTRMGAWKRMQADFPKIAKAMGSPFPKGGKGAKASSKAPPDTVLAAPVWQAWSLVNGLPGCDSATLLEMIEPARALLEGLEKATADLPKPDF